jgi:hypothetical protein
MRIAMFGLLAVLVAAPAAAGGDVSGGALDDAKVLANRKEFLKAAERFGDAIAALQKAGDLQGEEAAAHDVEEALGMVNRVTPPSPEGSTSPAPTRAAVLAALAQRLDPLRCGAYVSAPVLAREVLCLATETGDLASADAVAKIAAAHAKRATSGRAAAVVAAYAQGAATAAAGKLADAAPLLDAATADAAKAGWVDLAVHAATEAAASWAKAGAEDKALASVNAGIAAFGASPSRSKVNDWHTWASQRLAAAPESVRKAMDEFAKKQTGGSSVSASGGRGGRGGNGAPGGGEPVSEIAKLLPKLGKGKPVVSVRRTAQGMLIQWATPEEPEKPRTFESMVRVADAGGVTVALFDRSVSLMMVDLKGTRGQPGESSQASDVRAYYLLAEGETWNVSKDGVVTITR